jgi:hypothetical protein
MGGRGSRHGACARSLGVLRDTPDEKIGFRDAMGKADVIGGSLYSPTRLSRAELEARNPSPSSGESTNCQSIQPKNSRALFWNPAIGRLRYEATAR